MSDHRIVSFRDLDAWQVAMTLSLTAYALAKTLPWTERFELSSQIRRAAASVPANIAEGQTNGGIRVCLRHLRIALGSLGELSTLLELGSRLGMLDETAVESAEREVTRTGQLLHGLVRSKRRQLLKTAASGTLALLAAPALGWMILAVLD